MKRWEYKTDGFHSLYTKHINEYGSEGWELISVNHDPDDKRFPWECVFKREIVK